MVATDTAEQCIRESSSCNQRSVASPLWREITTRDARTAIEGTNLEPVVCALASPANPPLPPELTIPKALALAAANLSKPIPKWLSINHGASGTDLAKFRINTGARGQIPVVWTLIVGRTSSGKDIGDLVPAFAHQFGGSIGTLASTAGLYEALAEQGAGLLTVSEFESYLDRRSSRSAARAMMTTAFNQYSFDIRLARNARKSSVYAALSIAAHIQMDVLRSHITRADMESGFLPRFLFSVVPESSWRPSVGKTDLSPAIDALAVYDRMRGEITPPADYLGGLHRTFESNGGNPKIFGRYVNEYGPRIACILQADGREIRDEYWDRAAVLVQWFYSMAEVALGAVLSGKEGNKFERDLDSLCAYILRMTQETGGVTKVRISRNWGRGTAAYRNKLLAELIERGRIRQLLEGRYVATEMDDSQVNGGG